jgi:hypothetical protein
MMDRQHFSHGELGACPFSFLWRNLSSGEERSQKTETETSSYDSLLSITRLFFSF